MSSQPKKTRKRTRTRRANNSNSGDSASLPYYQYGGREPLLRRVALNTAPGRVFPDILSVWMTTQDITVGATGVASYSETYKANGVGTGVGPRQAYAGAYAANFPSALKYLMSSNAIPGNAPYYQARIIESRIRVDVIPDQYVNSANSQPFTIGLLPTANLSLAGLSASNINEQPLAKFCTVGPTTAGKITTLRHAIRTGTLFGQRDDQVRTNDDYLFTYNSDPVNLAFWQIYVRSFNGSDFFSTKFSVTIEHHFEFVVRLNLTTVTPTVSLPDVPVVSSAPKDLSDFVLVRRNQQ